MAASNPNSISMIPVRLYIAGVQAGVTRGHVFFPNTNNQIVTAEEFGHSPNKVVYISQAPVLTCVLRSFDSTVLSSVLPSRSASNSSPKTGSEIAGKEVKLVPLNSADPILTLHNAVCMVGERSGFNFGYSKDIGLELVFRALPNTSGSYYSI